MKKALFLLIIYLFFLVSCTASNVPTSNNQTNSSNSSSTLYSSNTSEDTSQSIPQSVNPKDYAYYPQTIIINKIRYDMIVDLTNSMDYELDQLIGHIIHEDSLTKYYELYPNLIPVVDNYMHNSFTNDMIEIYSVKNMDTTKYLALKIISEGNIVHTELFKSN